MASSIRQSNTVKGIKINEIEHKISQYADDSYLFIYDIPSLNNAIDFIEQFSKFAGLKLNLEKTEGIWLGNYKDEPPDYDKIKLGIVLLNALVYTLVMIKICVTKRIGI